MYEFQSASRAFGLVNNNENSPLFVMMLRNPIDRMMSLYNHWYHQELNTGDDTRQQVDVVDEYVSDDDSGNGYALSLEELVKLELKLLNNETPRSYLSFIKTSLINRRNIFKIQKAIVKLRKYMEVRNSNNKMMIVDQYFG